MPIPLNHAGAGVVTLAAPASGSYTLTLPTAVAAVNGYVLSSDTSGTLSWAAGGGGGGGAEADTLATVTGRGATTATALSITNATASTAVGSGALIVTGGVGIAGGLYVGDNVFLLGNTSAAKYLTISPNTIAGDVSSQGAYVRLGNPVSGNPPDLSGIQFASYSGAASGLGSIVFSNGGAKPGLELNTSLLSGNNIWLTTGTGTGGVVVSSLLTLTEILNTKTTATGVVAHDYNTGSTWYHTSISANFTANFTNVPTTDARTVVVSLILVQGATAYIPSALQVAGSALTIKWVNGVTPSGNPNKVDIATFTLIRSGAAWAQALGSYASFG